MKKIRLSSYYIILFIFLQVSLCLVGVNVHAEGEITQEQRDTIMDHCDTMKDNLKSLQRTDSRARVYLGRYYETILTNFITPLNLRLVENNISDARLLENQTNFVAKRANFVNDYISYQQALEELVNTNCKSEPERFYERLGIAREKRKLVNKDVTKLRNLTSEQQKMVEELKNGI